MMTKTVLTSMACALLAVPVSAQVAPPGPTTQTGDPRKDARLHVGPFHMTPSLTVTNLGVDTNVFNDSGEQKSDFTATLIPKMTVWTPVSNRLLITTALSNGITYFRKYTKQSSLDPGVSVRAELTLRRLILSGSGSYVQSRQRPNYEIDVRVPQTSTGNSLGFSYEIASRLQVAATAFRNRSRYDSDAFFQGQSLRERLNRVQQGVQFRLDRQLTSLTGVHVVGENRQDRFQLSPDRDANGVRFAFGATFGRKALISGEAEVGIRRMQPVKRALEPFNGVVAQVGLTHQRQGATAYHLDWNRDVEFSYDAIHTYYVLNSTKFSYRRQIGGKFDGIAAFGRNYSTYAKVASVEGVPRSVTKTASVDLGYRLTRDARLGFGVTRNWRNSDPPNGRDYSGIRAGLSFSLGF